MFSFKDYNHLTEIETSAMKRVEKTENLSKPRSRISPDPRFRVLACYFFVIFISEFGHDSFIAFRIDQSRSMSSLNSISSFSNGNRYSFSPRHRFREQQRMTDAENQREAPEDLQRSRGIPPAFSTDWM